jgi:hypothetical protein
LILSTTQPCFGSSADRLLSYLGSSKGTSTLCQGAVLRNCPRCSSAHVEASACDSPGSNNSAIAALAFGLRFFSAIPEMTRWPRHRNRGRSAAEDQLDACVLDGRMVPNAAQNEGCERLDAPDRPLGRSYCDQ